MARRTFGHQHRPRRLHDQERDDRRHAEEGDERTRHVHSRRTARSGIASLHRVSRVDSTGSTKEDTDRMMPGIKASFVTIIISPVS